MGFWIQKKINNKKKKLTKSLAKKNELKIVIGWKWRREYYFWIIFFDVFYALT